MTVAVGVLPTQRGRVVPQLTRLGASVHADLVYRYLLLAGPQSRPGLAQALGLVPRQVGDALDELQEYAAIEPVGRAGRRGLWTARPTDELLAVLRARRERLAAARQGLRRCLALADITGVTTDRLGAATPITNLDLARRRFHDAVGGATGEHLAMNPESAFTRSAASAAAPVGLRALRNGARTSSLGVPADDEDESGAFHGEAATHERHEYRELPAHPVKLSVVDRRVAFFPIDPTRHFQGGVWEITDSSTVDDLASFFLRRWEAAVAPSPRPRLPAGLTDRERAVLHALAQGDTDEMAAQRLALSSRTIRYVIRELMDRFAVSTRFQLGLVVGSLTAHTPHSEGDES